MILMQDSTHKDWQFPAFIKELSDLFLCDKYGNLMLFNSSDLADEFREEHAIDGQIIEIPFY